MTTWTKEQQAEHRKLWVEALRSGKYEQTQARLKRGDGFCCLGVACDISGLGSFEPDEMGNGVSRYVTDGDVSNNVLPTPVKQWLGLSNDEGYFISASGADYLTTLNDRGGSFAAIADIIESEPEGLIAS
jgi:hypothetical protein